MALDQVQTPFAFLSDIDFLPMSGLYPILKRSVQTMKLSSTNKVHGHSRHILERFQRPVGLCGILQDSAGSFDGGNVY